MLFAVADNDENMFLASIGAGGFILSLVLIIITTLEACGFKKIASKN